MIKVTALDHFVLRVRDLDAALGFYRDILGLPIDFLDDYRAGRRPFVSVRVGQQLIDLVPDPTYDPEQGRNSGGFLHLCVGIAGGSLQRVLPWLKERGVHVLEDQPMPRMGATGMGLSIYVTDPDGYVVELKEHGT
jgi:catechol 2,3-dioxygenase-like lactoylglutathione lyase family enzyme